MSCANIADNVPQLQFIWNSEWGLCTHPSHEAQAQAYLIVLAVHAVHQDILLFACCVLAVCMEKISEKISSNRGGNLDRSPVGGAVGCALGMGLLGFALEMSLCI